MTATGNIRPLTARSVLLSTLLGVDPPELPAAVLVGTARLFGIEDGTARVALSRMAAAGEVDADGGRYRLTGRLLERQARQAAGRHPRIEAWDGTWHVAVVTAGKRPAAERSALRTALTRARLAEWREGVWARPANLPRPDLPADVVDHVTWLVATPDDPPEALWDLDGWAATARELRSELAATPPESLAPGFVLSAAVLRHLAADPLLPPELLPDGWPGAELRTAYEAWDAAYQDVLAAYHRDLRGNGTFSPT